MTITSNFLSEGVPAKGSTTSLGAPLWPILYTTHLSVMADANACLESNGADGRSIYGTYQTAEPVGLYVINKVPRECRTYASDGVGRPR